MTVILHSTYIPMCRAFINTHDAETHLMALGLVSMVDWVCVYDGKLCTIHMGMCVHECWQLCMHTKEVYMCDSGEKDKKEEIGGNEQRFWNIL